MKRLKPLPKKKQNRRRTNIFGAQLWAEMDPTNDMIKLCAYFGLKKQNKKKDFF